MLNSKYGQLNLINFVIGIVIFLLVWGIWAGKFIAEWCQNAITENGITGIEAFLLSYMNLWIFLMLLICVALVYYMSGGSQ
jgi:hypothetical protein